MPFFTEGDKNQIKAVKQLTEFNLKPLKNLLT
jgi:hypothetical protein